MGLYLSVSLNVVEAGSQTLEIAHSFSPTGSRPLDYFYIVTENPFSTNLLAEQDPVATIITPTSSSTLWDTVGVTINGEDNSEVVNAKFWVDYTEIINPYTIHLDDYWFTGFDTRDFSEGTHTLSAKVYDRFGAFGQTSIPIVIENDGWGQITSPSQGETELYGDNLYFLADVYDHSGVDLVQYKIERITGEYWATSWINAYYDTLFQKWRYIWYDQPSTGTYKVYCREFDTFGRVTDIDTVTFEVDYGTILTHQITPLQYSAYSGTTTSGKYDDNSYFGVRCTGIGWGWWQSYTDFYFNPVSTCISNKVELQITQCTSDVILRIYFSDGTIEYLYPSETQTTTQTLSLANQGKTINRIRLIHKVWWLTYQWVYIDFIRVLYRIY